MVTTVTPLLKSLHTPLQLFKKMQQNTKTLKFVPANNSSTGATRLVAKNLVWYVCVIEKCICGEIIDIVDSNLARKYVIYALYIS